MPLTEECPSKLCHWLLCWCCPFSWPWCLDARTSRGFGRDSPTWAILSPCTGSVPPSLHFRVVMDKSYISCCLAASMFVKAVCGGASISCARPRWEVVDTYVWVDINSMSRRCFPLGAVFRAVNCIHDGFSLVTNYLECFSGNFPGLVAFSRRFGVVMLMLADGGFPLRRDDRDEYRITDCSPQPRPIALLHIFLCF